MSTDEPVELSLEQQFSLRSFETRVEKLSHENTQKMLVEMYAQMMLREEAYKRQLKEKWGITPPKLD